MGNGQPYMYDSVSYNNFDPKAVSRASLAPKPPRPKQDGPLISFNQHPDSYLILPYGNNTARPLKPSIKKRIYQTRIVQLVLRCFELIGACGLLVMMILITNIPASTSWIMRIPPGVAILHTLYGMYHLSRKPSGRTPASSASYMLFASVFDVAIIPFYVFTAMITSAQYKLDLGGTGLSGQWNTLLAAGQTILPTLTGTAFLCAVISGGFHLISLGLSLWLAITFRKIANLPPDMNPLEDNLTSRHKRNKSSISLASSAEKRLSEPLEAKRNSGAPYEDLSRPPSIPFLATRENVSTSSFSTYHSNLSGSRDSRLDLPSRKDYASPSASMTNLKRTSVQAPPSPTKHASYEEVHLSDNSSDTSSRRVGNMKEAWYATDSLPPRSTRASQSPKRSSYRPLHQRTESTDHEDLSLSLVNSHVNPLGAHPSEHNPHAQAHRKSRSKVSTLSDITLTANNSGDLAETMRLYDDEPQKKPLAQPDNFKAKLYGELRAATPPILISGGMGRQVSSGNDFSSNTGRRDVSGKVAEEGRGGPVSGWGTRFRKISGLGETK